MRDGKPSRCRRRPRRFLTTSAFTLGAKLRLLREPFVAPDAAGVEESIAAFVRRRLGDEFLDYAIDPFVAGIYAGDPERISVPAAFPRLLALEQKYGSLIKGQILGARERRKSEEVAKNTAKSFSFRERHADADRRARRARVARVHCGVRVRADRARRGRHRVRSTATRGGEPFALRGARRRRRHAGAYAAAAIVRDLAPDAAQALGRDRVRADRDRREPRTGAPTSRIRCAGFGFLVPKKERRQRPGLAVLEQHVRRAARRTAPCC